jgi:OOP family OmpA-OmpF porin
MKTKHLLLIFVFLLNALNLTAQTEEQTPKITSDSILKGYNKWTIEGNFGNAKGIKPYATGYYSNNFTNLASVLNINSFSFGARYMINPKFGFKVAMNHQELIPKSSSNSLPFKMQQYGMSFEGVINITRLLDLEKAFGRVGILFHSGLKFDHMISKTYNIVGDDQNYNEFANNFGIVIGLSPQFRITNKLAAQFDYYVQNNYRQKFNWDGSSSSKANNLSGKLLCASFGLNYALGKSKTHADWTADIESDNLQLKNDSLTKKIESLEKSLEQFQVLMNDTKGVMIDVNKNGTEGELETNATHNNIEKNIATIAKSNPSLNPQEIVKSLINDGTIVVYFEVDKVTPTTISSENIYYIKSYLKNYPKAIVEIIGHGDVTGSAKLNDSLGKERAKSVQNILIDSGIQESQIKIISESEDQYADKDSNEAKKLVGTVTFKIN